MTLTREALAERARQREREKLRQRTGSRNLELWLLLAAALVVVGGLYLVYAAKLGRQPATAAVVDLNTLAGPQPLLPLLGALPSQADEEFAANRIFETRRHGARFENDGAVARLRVKESDIAHVRGLTDLPERLADAKRRREEREEAREAAEHWIDKLVRKLRGTRAEREVSVPLLAPAVYAALKPALVVRTQAQFRSRFWLWTLLFVGAFCAVHVFWRARRFAGDNLLLPVVFVLCGIGLMLMVSLRDPLRDTLLFSDFAMGVLAGAAAMALASVVDFERTFGRLSFVPLAAAVLLAMALGIFGNGPGGSDAKVNLLFFQPVELIRLLLVLFLAGYFAQNWDALRQLRQQGAGFTKQGWNVPRLDYLLPVILAVLLSILLFFWLSDLGPALIMGCLFLILYSIARKQVVLAAAGLAAIVMAFVIGYALGFPHTVTERVNMWKSPWDNAVRGGDQLADSLWALSTGGVSGTGGGLGDPDLMPAAHTDLILSSLGEEYGWVGIAVVFGLYGILLWRSLRIARCGPGTYSYFLVVGFALILILQLLLIAGGLLGLMPLSGVVSPFLSYGRTSMVVNFLLVGAILSVSSRESTAAETLRENFGAPTRVLAGLLAGLLLLMVLRAGFVQAVRADSILTRGALVTQADGGRRYQYNPRLTEAARLVPKGTIFDRNGLPLATSDAAVVGQHQAEYQQLGVTPAKSAGDEQRLYPMGARFFYLLGDTRSRLKQGAGNTAFQERTSRVRLQGYDDVATIENGRLTRDFRELVPLVRHRWEPENPQVAALLARPRDIKMTIDARLQMRVSTILEQHLLKLGKDKGAAVVLDPATGDMLAAVSYPIPSEAQFTALSGSSQTPMPTTDLIDRTRFGLYPPGSSFKIVTTIAALRKDPGLVQQRYECVRLPDGRIGNYVGQRAIRDDVEDKTPHGSVDMAKGIAVSCNAYFAQLGVGKVGADNLFEAASLLGISVARPNTAKQLNKYLAQAAYGQGQVVASPFQMARVAATIANNGEAPEGRWVLDETNTRVRAPEAVLPANLAAEVGRFMRAVVTSGTARSLNSSAVPIAGKTGTAELAHAPSHAWFIGYAPYGAPPNKQIAFAVLVENGQYGGTAAAPIAGEIVAAAKQLGIL